ncbi:YraN family protein [Patescibacteria group bacterium]
MNKRSLGEKIEKEIANYLKIEGFEILVANWTCRWGELDIVARDKEELVFVEVKYRKTTKFGYPVESFTSKKKKSLLRTINYYLQKNPEKTWRFDLVTVLGDKVKHYKSVSLEG